MSVSAGSSTDPWRCWCCLPPSGSLGRWSSAWEEVAMLSSELTFKIAELESAAALVHRTLSPTPQYNWPKLSRRAGCSVWVKHENHTPTGAFKVRGGLVYLSRLRANVPKIGGVISATRGNHGQSIAYAAARVGLPA